MRFVLITLTLLLVSCQTDTFDFDKLSTDTGLSPEFRLPLGSIGFEAQEFLDSLDLIVEYDRDDYGTIFLKDTIHDIASVAVAEVFDINTLSSDFSVSYATEDLEVSDFQNTLPSFSIENVTTPPIPDGVSVPVMPFTTSVDLGATNLFGESFSEVTFASGVLTLSFTNNFPIDATIDFDLVNANGQVFVQTVPQTLSPGMSAQQQVDLTNKELSQSINVVLNISSPGSLTPVTIDYATQTVGLEISVVNASVSKATLSADRTFDYNFSELVAFDASSDVSLRQLNLKEATMQLEVENQLGFAASMSLVNPGSFVSGNPFQRTYSLSSSSNPQDFDWNMDDVELNFQQNPTTGASELAFDFDMSFTLDSGQVIESNRMILVSGSFQNLVLDTAFGDFGVVEEITEETFSIGGDLDDLVGTVQVFEPKIDLLVHNTFGLPASLSTSITAYRKDMSSMDFEVDPSIEERLIEAPTMVFDTVTTKLTYDNTNSNIEDLLAFVPDDELRAEIKITTNPAGVPAVENFLSSDSKFWLDAEIETPVHFNIDNFNMQDTISVTPPLEGKDVDQLVEASIRLDYTSDLPISFVLNSGMIDSQTQSVLVTFDPIVILAAQTNEDGEVVSPAQGTINIVIDGGDKAALQTGDEITLDLVANSTDNQNKNAKISGNAALTFELSASLKIDLDE